MKISLDRASSSLSAAGIIIQLADGTIQGCNEKAERILGYTTDRMMKAAYFELPWQTIHEDGSAFPPDTHPAIVTLKTGKPNFNVVMGFYKPNGELIWLSIDCQPLFQSSKSLPYAVVISFIDITERKSDRIATQALEAARSIQSQAQGRLTILFVEDNPEDRAMYRRYLQTDSENRYIFVEAESGEEALEICRQYQPDLVLLDYLLPDMDGLEWLARWHQMSKNSPPVIVLTGQGDENIAVEFVHMGAADYLVKDRLNSEKPILKVRRAISEHRLRKQHQQILIEIQQDRQFTEQITNTVPAVIHLYDAIAGCNIYTNSQTYDLLGYTPEQILEMGTNFLFQIMHPEDLERFPAHLEKLKRSNRDEVCQFEYRMRHKNGKWLWFCSQDRVFSRTQNGSIHHLLGIAVDITERKHTEATLRQSEERLMLATIASNLGMWFWDLIEDKLEWTDQCKQLFGLDPNTEISYELFLNKLHSDDRDLVDRAVKEALANQTEYNIEYRVVWLDDSIHWLAAKGKGFYNETGEPIRMMGTVQDISDRKEIEQSLQSSNQRITNILESMTDAFYTLDRDFNFTYLNPEAERLLGKSKLELLGKNIWQEFPPAIGTEIDRQYHLAFTEQRTSRFEYYYFPFETWFEICVYPSVEGLSVYFHDITEKKLAANRLAENERLLRLALSSAKAGSWNWEITTGQVIWSPENYDLYGLDPQQELLGYENWQNSIHPEDRNQVNREVQQILDGQFSEFKTEFRIIHPTKGIRWLSGIGNVTRNQNGEPIRLSGINLDISDRKSIEEASQVSEQRLRKILDSLMIFAGIITTEGEVLEINQTALELAGLQPENVLQQKFCETYWWSYSPEIKAQLKNAIQRAANGESVRYDILARVGENDFIIVDFSLVPVFNADNTVEYLIASGIDISDREASQQALQQSEYELRLITEVIPQQIWTASPSGKVDYINQRWYEYTGVTLEEIEAKGWETIVHPDDLPQVSQAWTQSIQSGEKYNLEARLRKADGTYNWFLGRARPLRNERGKIIKWYGTNTSISQIKELEEKLRQQTEDLIRANQLKDEFLAIVSHELRTPLNPILGWSQLLATGKLDAEKIAIGLETIERNAKLQAQLIDDLLDVSRILRGKLDLKLTPINLESVIKLALETVQLAAEAKSIEIETRFEPNIGQVLGDAGRLQQIFWNLLSNAIKFTPDRGKVIVRLERIGIYSQIQISDTGTGIEPDFLPYVFDRFRQAESSSTRQFGGLGLGLAIVRHLTELHKGTVTVTSPGKGKGATFTVKFPSIDVTVTNNLDSMPINNSAPVNFLNGTQILIVDDDPDSRDLLTFILEKEGVEVRAVASAHEALVAFKKSTPDLIISDIGMPEIDGYTLISQIRSLPEGKTIPAIALTAHASELNRQRCLDCGFHEHIAKPINIPHSIAIIRQLIR